MSLKDTISEQMKSAMKSGDKNRLETLRSVRAMILEFEKSGADKELTPDAELTIVNAAVKKRKESAELYRNGNRIDLAEKEEAELAVLMEFLPKQFSDTEAEDFIRNLATELGVSGKADFGKLMSASAKALKGKYEGAKVKTIVERILS